MRLMTTTLTLPCHKVELRPVAVQARLCTLFENACQGLMITPEQLRRELEENSDIPDLAFGALTTGTPKGACDKRTQLRERLVHYTLRH
jgi:hypothetical protein